MTYYLITCDINALYRNWPNALYRGGRARTCPLPPLYGAYRKGTVKGIPPLYRKKGHVRGRTGSYAVAVPL